MGGFLDRLLGKKEASIFTISFGAVPSWLDSREKVAKSTLDAETGEIRSRIRQGILDLQRITVSVAQAEQDEELHPKLKSIARNSLPQYIKAMNGALGRELPEDIDAFYPAAVECLKSCLNSTRGQGRYLHAVFPEEMKAVKTGIDAIGRDINEITGSLGRFRNEKTRIDAVRALHTALLDISEDIRKAQEKDSRITARVAELSGRGMVIAKDLAELPSNPGMADADELRSALQEAEGRRDTAMRTNAALSMTASHVFRKAEKIAVRQKHPSEIGVLRHAMELLSDHETPDTSDLSETLSGAFPIANRMIAAGEISLKNKEERAIFSDIERFRSDIISSYEDIATREDACTTARQKLESHPLVARGRSLEREKTQIETMLKKEEQARTELREWQEKTRQKVPHLIAELTKRVGDMVGGGVQLQIDDQRLA